MAPPESAFQVENFDPPPDEELICSICHCVFCNPVQCPCNHVFCQVCLDKWLDIQKSCPVCRKKVLRSSIHPVAPLINNMIMKLKLKCPNSKQGCIEKITLESFEQHQKECLYNTVICKYKKCEKMLSRKDLFKHEKICKFRLIRCKRDCCLLLPLSVAKKHECIEELKKRLAEKHKLERKLKKQLEEQRNELKRAQEELERLRATNPSNDTLEYISDNTFDQTDITTSDSSVQGSLYSSDETSLDFSDESCLDSSGHTSLDLSDETSLDSSEQESLYYSN